MIELLGAVMITAGFTVGGWAYINRKVDDLTETLRDIDAETDVLRTMLRERA